MDRTIKLYLDDERVQPDGWTRVKTAKRAIEYLETGMVNQISLDHDLGNDDAGTGYDVICWIEKQVALTNFNPPTISIHSANSSAVQKMKLAHQSISRLLLKKSKDLS